MQRPFRDDWWEVVQDAVAVPPDTSTDRKRDIRSRDADRGIAFEGTRDGQDADGGGASNRRKDRAVARGAVAEERWAEPRSAISDS